MAWICSAMKNGCSSLSMTQGPPISAKRRPPPISTEPTWTVSVRIGCGISPVSDDRRFLVHRRALAIFVPPRRPNELFE